MKQFVKKYKTNKIPPDIIVAEKISKLNDE